jgi:hypothetical protein
MLETFTAQRRVGRFAWAMAWIATIGGELHALARHATEDGKGDLELPLTRAWSVPATDLLGSLLNWADPDTVYLTYGKIWLPVFVSFTLAAFVVFRRRRPTGFEKWAWHLTLTGYVILTVAVFGDYYTPWIAQAFLVTVTALLLSLAGSTVLGVALLRSHFRPRVTPWLLVLWLPLLVGITQITSLGNAVLPAIWAWVIAIRRPAPVDRSSSSTPAAPHLAS